jgi:oxygen-dependent protoporphyrinogen oxidase
MGVGGRVIVVGAGISGLTAAFWLHRSGVDVTVLEGASWAGGTMKTLRDGGWLIETGPNSALETTPLFGEMFDALGITGERLYADPASDKRYILRAGELHALPMSPIPFFRSRLWTAQGKLRLLKEPFIGRAVREETIAEFVERRLGREFLDYAINPFVAGVYAGNPEQLSVRTAFPKLYALEEKYGGLIRGMIGGARERRRRAEKAKDRAKMFSFVNGMQTFPAAIAAKLGDRVKFESPVMSVSRVIDGDHAGMPGFALRCGSSGISSSRKADVVVLAVPANAAARLVIPFSPGLSRALDHIYYPPVAEVFLGYERSRIARDLEGFGYLVPAKEQRNVLGTIWSSSLFPGRSPQGYVALTTFVGGSRQPDLLSRDDAELLALVRNDLGSIMGVRGEPAYRTIIRWDRAIPQYNLGYYEVLEMLERVEHDTPGLFFCSNYRGGIAVGDCVMNGERIARRILDFLKTHDTARQRSLSGGS